MANMFPWSLLQLPDTLTWRWVKQPGDLDLWPWKWRWVMHDVGYLCANFCLPRPLCSQLRPDVCKQQMSDVRCQTGIIALRPRLL